MEINSMSETAASTNDKKKMSPRTKIRILVVFAFWILMTIVLWNREFRYRGVEGVTGDSSPSFFVECLNYSKDGSDIGTSFVLLQEKDGGHQLTQRGELILPILQNKKPTRFAGELSLDSNYNFLSAHYMFNVDGSIIETRGIVNEQNQLEIEFNYGSGKQTFTRNVPEDGLSMTLGAMPILAKRVKFEPNNKYSFQQFNPFTSVIERVDVTFGKETEILHAAKLIPVLQMETEAGGFKTSALVTREGRTIREDSPLGFQGTQIAMEELLLDIGRNGDPLNILDLIPFAQDAAEAVEAATEVLYLSVKATATRQLDLENSRQRFVDPDADILEIRPSRIPEPTEAITLAYPLSLDEANEQPERIRKLSSEILGDLDVISEPMTALTRIVRWIDQNIDEHTRLEKTDFIGTLASRCGNKNDKAELFIALARSARVPAEIATGLAYDRGAFFLRKWALIRISNNVEIEIDPAKNLQPVDSRYLRLSNDTYKDQGKLAWALSNLSISSTQNENVER